MKQESGWAVVELAALNPSAGSSDNRFRFKWRLKLIGRPSDVSSA